MKILIADDHEGAKQLEDRLVITKAHRDSGPFWYWASLRDGRSFMLSKIALAALRVGRLLHIRIGDENYQIVRTRNEAALRNQDNRR